MVSMNRINPPEHIQSLMVLAPGPDDRLPSSASLAPHTSKLWMETETSFIFEDDDLIIVSVTDGLEFFLTQNGMFSRPSAMLARSDISVASIQTPTRATVSGLAALEWSPYAPVSGTLRLRLRPNELVAVQNPWEKTAKLSPRLVCMNHSRVAGGQAVPDLPPQPFLLCWHVGSTSQRSTETAQTTPQLAWSASRSESVTIPQCGCQPRRQEQFQPFEQDFPASPVDSLFQEHACLLPYHCVW